MEGNSNTRIFGESIFWNIFRILIFWMFEVCGVKIVDSVCLGTLCENPEIWTGQNRSPIFWYVVLNNNVVEHYEKRIKILHGCPFEGWPNRARPSKPFLPKRVGRSSKGHPCMILILSYCYISWLSNSVSWTQKWLRIWHQQKLHFDASVGTVTDMLSQLCFQKKHYIQVL